MPGTFTALIPVFRSHVDFNFFFFFTKHSLFRNVVIICEIVNVLFERVESHGVAGYVFLGRRGDH